jgi:outer membrane cobalamin receptor
MEIKNFYEVDGHRFEEKGDAENYLKKCEEKEAKAKKLAEEKDARWREVNSAWDTYVRLANQFNKDYETKYSSIFDWRW